MKATKREWLTREKVINNLQYAKLSDGLLSALWDAVEQIKPIQQATSNTRQSLAEKYALLEDGEVQTRRKLAEAMQGDEDDEPPSELNALLEDYLQVETRQGTILVEQEEAFRDAMNEHLDEVVDLDIAPVALSVALRSEASMGELQQAVGWIIESRASKGNPSVNGTRERQPSQ